MEQIDAHTSGPGLVADGLDDAPQADAPAAVLGAMLGIAALAGGLLTATRDGTSTNLSTAN